MNPTYFLTLCMIVRNEEEQLSQCLQSAEGVVDSIIVVDTGSEDGTKDIARQFGARILAYEWNNDFAAARNHGLEAADSQWILHLDADERLACLDKYQLKKELNMSQSDGLTLPVRNYQPDNDLVQYLDDPQIRIFRGDRGYRYEQAVHEQIGPSIAHNNGVVTETDILIEHFGYKADPKIKAARNLPILQRMTREQPSNPYIHFKMGETLKALNRFEDARKHFLEVLKLNYSSLPGELIDTLLLRLGQIELAMDNYSAVLKYCLEGLKINPNNILSMYVLSIALIYLGDTERVSAYLKRIRQLNRNNKIDPSDLDKLETVCRALKVKHKAS